MVSCCNKGARLNSILNITKTAGDREQSEGISGQEIIEKEGILIYWHNGIVAKGQDLSSQRWKIRNVTRYQEWRNSP